MKSELRFYLSYQSQNKRQLNRHALQHSIKKKVCSPITNSSLINLAINQSKIHCKFKKLSLNQPWPEPNVQYNICFALNMMNREKEKNTTINITQGAVVRLAAMTVIPEESLVSELIDGIQGADTVQLLPAILTYLADTGLLTTGLMTGPWETD